jgi:hypothetical protein
LLVFGALAPASFATSARHTPESLKSQGKIERFLKMVCRMYLAQKLH